MAIELADRHGVFPASQTCQSGAMEMQAIGRVSSPRIEPLDDDWDSITSTITLDGSRFTADALRGLDAFSHVEVVDVFDRVDDRKIRSREIHGV